MVNKVVVDSDHLTYYLKVPPVVPFLFLLEWESSKLLKPFSFRFLSPLSLLLRLLIWVSSLRSGGRIPYRGRRQGRHVFDGFF